MKITNHSKNEVRIGGFAVFAPEETREVSDTDAEILLKNDNFSLSSEKSEETQTPKKK
jgi:hypothetical protein